MALSHDLQEDSKSGKKKRKSPRFIEIISEKVRERGEKKEQKKQAEQVYNAVLARVQPWIDSGREKLGWRDDEFGPVDAKVKEAKKTRKKDIGQATQLLREAEDLGNAAQYTFELRRDGTGALRTVLDSLGSSTSPQAVKIRQQVAGLEKRLQGTKAEELEKALEEAESLVDEVAEFEPETQIEPKRLKLGLELMTLLREQAIACMTALRKKFGRQDDGMKSGFFLEELEKVPAIVEAKALLSKANDNPKLTEAAAQLEDLDKRFAEAKGKIEKACLAFQGNLEKDGGKEGKALFGRARQEGQESKKSDEQLAAIRKFEADFEPVEQALARFLDLGTTDGPTVAEQVKYAREKTIATNDFANAPKVVADLLKLIQFLTQTAIKDLKGDATALGGEIDGIVSSLEKQKKAAGRLTAAYDALILEAKQIKPLVKTNNPGAFKSARLLVEQLKEAGLGTAATKVAEFNATCDAIELVTGDKATAKEFPTDTDTITKAMKVTVDGVDLHDFDASIATLAGLKGDSDALKLKADELARWRRGAAAQLELLKKRIDEINSKLSEKTGMFAAIREAIGGSDVLRKTVFGQDYTAVHDGYDKVGVDMQAMQDKLFAAHEAASKIADSIKSGEVAGAREALKTDMQAAETREKEENEKKKKTEDEHAAIQKEYDDFVKLLRETRKAVANDPIGDEEELKELETLRDQVRKKLKAKDFDDAAKQLRGGKGNDGIAARLQKLHDTPGGVTADSLKKLEQIGDLWDKAQQKVGTAIEAILVKARPVAQRLQVDIKEIDGQTEGLKKKLFAFDFNEPVKTLLDKKADLKQRKAAREAALKEVRAARAALLANPVAERLRQNPFGLGSPFTEYRAFLDSVEYNALRAVPPE
jgi:hypothetical protein